MSFTSESRVCTVADMMSECGTNIRREVDNLLIRGHHIKGVSELTVTVYPTKQDRLFGFKATNFTFIYTGEKVDAYVDQVQQTVEETSRLFSSRICDLQ